MPILFLQQICTITKSFQHQPAQKQTLYDNLAKCGLFPAIVFSLQHSDPVVRVAGTEILVALIDHDISIIRSFLYDSDSTDDSIINGEKPETNRKPLTDTLIGILLTETDLGVKAQVAEAVKVLLDTVQIDAEMNASPEGPVAEAIQAQRRNEMLARHSQPDRLIPRPDNTFLTTFLSQSADKLFQPLFELGKHQEAGTPLQLLSQSAAALYTHLIEILIFLLRTRTSLMTGFIATNNLLLRPAALLHSPEKSIQLTAIKFYRCVIDLNVELFNNFIATHSTHIMLPILSLVARSAIGAKPRDNLLTSAALEFFEFLRNNYERHPVLIISLAQNHRDAMDAIPRSYIYTFAGLLLCYERILNPPEEDTLPADSSVLTSDAGSPAPIAPIRRQINGGGRRWQGLEDMSATEEAYFDAEDDEEETGAGAQPDAELDVEPDAGPDTTTKPEFTVEASQDRAKDEVDSDDTDELSRDEPTPPPPSRENGEPPGSRSPGKTMGLGLAMEMGAGMSKNRKRLVEYEDEEEIEAEELPPARRKRKVDHERIRGLPRRR